MTSELSSFLLIPLFFESAYLNSIAVNVPAWREFVSDWIALPHSNCNNRHSDTVCVLHPGSHGLYPEIKQSSKALCKIGTRTPSMW